MTILGCAGEALRDVELVRHLTDRVICDGASWIDPDSIEHLRRWTGVEGESWLDLHKARDLARTRRLRVHGHFDGKPGALDAQQTRSVLALFATEAEPPAAVLIARDEDGEPERRRGFEQAVAAGEWPFECVLALARPEIEAWQIAAWTPSDEREERRLAEVSAELGFDPTSRPARLTSTVSGSKRDAKAVLERLTGSSDSDLVFERFARVPLETLERDGRGCGLADFIDACRAQIVPLFR